MPEQVQESQILDVAARLRESQVNLLQLEDAMRRLPAFARDFGRDVLSIRQEHNKQANAFTTIYRAIYGSVPVGLQGVVLAAVGAGAALVVILSVVAWLILRENRLKDEAAAKQAEAAAQQAVEANTAAILSQADQEHALGKQAEAHGDVDAARQHYNNEQRLREQAESRSPAPNPQSGFAWFQKNWGWVAAAAAGVLIAPELVRKI